MNSLQSDRHEKVKTLNTDPRLMISQAVVTAGPVPEYAGAFEILNDATCSTAKSFACTRPD